MLGSFAAVIFDLDGTLIDSARVSVGVLNAMLRDSGKPQCVDLASIQQALSAGGEALIREALGSADSDVEQELAEFRHRLKSQPTPPECLYPGAAATLSELASHGIALGICTKKPERLTHKVLRELGLEPLFAAVSGGDSMPFPKPDPRHLVSVINTLKAPADRVLYVGDSHFDAQMATAAGIPFVFARYGYDDGRVDPTTSLACIDKLDQILPLIQPLRDRGALPLRSVLLQ